jgi:erythromycin esterase
MEISFPKQKWINAETAIRANSIELAGPESLDKLVNDIGKARIVMLGEASHGTHEYYKWRAQITKKLIEEKGFNFVAVEGDCRIVTK